MIPAKFDYHEADTADAATARVNELRLIVTDPSPASPLDTNSM